MIELLPNDAIAALKTVLSEKRYQHCVRVMETGFQLFHAWRLPEKMKESLAWAGLFHDCAKEMPPRKQEEWLNNGICPYGEELLDTPGLVHAALGAKILQREYGIRDHDILKAVAYHSTGHPDLTSIGWIVYIADILEPGRKFVVERENILRAAYENPLNGLRLVTDLRHSISGKKGQKIHPLSIRFKDYIDSIDELNISK